MKNKLTKLIDVKSLVTLLMLITLVIAVLKNMQIDKDLFLLFSNLITMVFTYFFTKKDSGGGGDKSV